jgi:malonyl-CoA O-methyltransferase
MINKDQVCRHFGKMSKSYDDYAIVQKKMAHMLQKLAKKAGNFTHILEIGCGTGYFTKLLAQMYPQSEIIATDISPAMLIAAKNTLSNFSNVSYELADGENIALSKHFDLIISNAAFQWFHDYHNAFRYFYNALVPGGFLLYSTFGNHTFSELHTSFHAAHQSLKINEPVSRHGPTFISIDALNEISHTIGFAANYQEEYHKEYFCNVKDFLSSVKKVGANNATHANRIFFNRNLMFSMIQYYEQHFREDEQIYATYHAIYGCEQKPL